MILLAKLIQIVLFAFHRSSCTLLCVLSDYNPLIIVVLNGYKTVWFRPLTLKYNVIGQFVKVKT